MKTAKELRLKITYEIELNDVRMPQEAYDQLTDAAENGIDINIFDPGKYPDAGDWLVENVSERGCMDWEAEIINVS